MASIWRKACVGCTKSKRKCSKAVPACRRCVDKGITCVYPSARQNVTLAELETTAADGSVNPLTTTGPGSDDTCIESLDCSPLQLTGSDLVEGVEDLPSTAGPLQLSFANIAPLLSTDLWFLAPETWVADWTLPPSQPTELLDACLQRFVGNVQSWLQRWVTEGSSPLHHRYLYREKMPRCVQDAYTAIPLYYMTRNNADARATTARVLEDRVALLLEEQALETSLMPTSGKGLTMFDHVSRVQSLLTYQTIRLFDGDVRMRAQAEALIPTLTLWTQQLLESAEGSALRPERFLADLTNSLYSSCSGSSERDAIIWRTWILVESMRRTWIVASFIQAVYLYMKHGWGECTGRVANTMRDSLWNAASSYSWSKACREWRERGTLFLTQRAEDLFRDMRSEDVDEFSLMVVEMCYGVERFERWVGDAKSRRD